MASGNAGPMPDRRIDCFFYGLFMDARILRDRGVAPENPRPAMVEGFALRIGERATLIPSPSDRAYGMVMAVTRGELERLYSAPGLEPYRPEAVLALCLEKGGAVAALCYNLLVPPRGDERNLDYALQLQRLLRDLGFPADYAAAVTRL